MFDPLEIQTAKIINYAKVNAFAINLGFYFVD